jgi:thiol-disulfide isomerase/thioredoxin
MKKILFICLWTLCLSGQAQIAAPLIGNWIEKTSNRWEYGFFEKFAVYGCDFWEYASVRKQGNKTKILLQKGEQTLNLEIKQKNDSILTVKNGKQKSREYALIRKVYPDYSTPDTEPFPEPAFLQDSARIIGYYRNFDKISEQFKERDGHNYFEISIGDFIYDYIEGEGKDYRTSIDSLGRFSITVPVLNTQEAYTNGGRLRRQLILSPKDTLFLFADVDDLLSLVMGDNARVNNELIRYENPGLHVNRDEEVKKGISDMEYLRICEDVYNQRMKHLNDYISLHPNVSEKFRFYKSNEEKYIFSHNLMQHRFDLYGMEEQSFQNGYMDYVNAHFPLYQKSDYTFFKNYLWFLMDYIDYADTLTKVVTIALEDREKIMEEEGTLTPEIRRDFKELRELTEKIEAEPDSAKKMELFDSGKNLFERINANPLIEEARKTYSSRAFFLLDLSLVDSLITEPVLKELWTARLYLKRFDQKRTPLYQTDMEIFDSRIKNPFLRNRLLAINNRYLELKNINIDGNESLKNTDHLADIHDADEIFSRITEPYKGKVILMDFWGTWCSPCRANIKKCSKEIEEKMHGKDVIFMYVANNSPESAWKTFIKEMNLTGEQIVHYRLPNEQQRMLERKLKIRQFPTYVLIGRNGEIVNYDAPAPARYGIDGIINELEKALSE